MGNRSDRNSIDRLFGSHSDRNSTDREMGYRSDHSSSSRQMGYGSEREVGFLADRTSSDREATRFAKSLNHDKFFQFAREEVNVASPRSVQNVNFDFKRPIQKAISQNVQR